MKGFRPFDVGLYLLTYFSPLIAAEAISFVIATKEAKGLAVAIT
jgi:hypothetical protein